MFYSRPDHIIQAVSVRSEFPFSRLLEIRSLACARTINTRRLNGAVRGELNLASSQIKFVRRFQSALSSEKLHH